MANLKLREMLKAHGGKTAEGSQVPFSALYFDPAKDKRIVLGDIDTLASDIFAKGFRRDRPILVQMNEEKGLFEVKDGRRRYRALKMAMEKHGMDPNILIPIVVEESKNEADFLIATINANDDQAKPFEPMEEGAYFVALTEELPDDQRMSVDDIAKRVNKSVTYVRDRIALAKLDPEMKKEMAKFIESGTMSATAVTKIAKMKDPAEREAAWKDITTAHSESVNNSEASPATNKEKGGKPAIPKTGKIRVADVTKRTKGKSESISMKNLKANLKHCEEMREKTNSDMYKFGIKLIMAIIKNEVVNVR